MTPWRYEETKDYGYVNNYSILKIFGDELTYNQLKHYDVEDEYTKLVVSMNIKDKYNHMRVWLDDKLILDNNFILGQHRDMYYYLEELDE